jgi:hypothetical protein
MPSSAELIIFESGEMNFLAGAHGGYRFLEKAHRNTEKRRKGKFHQI